MGTLKRPGHAAMTLALDGAFDGRIIDILDEVPVPMLELVTLGGGSIYASAKSLTAPWAMQVDTTLARSLGFNQLSWW